MYTPATLTSSLTLTNPHPIANPNPDPNPNQVYSRRRQSVIRNPYDPEALSLMEP